MFPTVQNILDVLNEIAPFDSAESWDNPGLQVGDPTQQITRMCVALDPSLESLRECIREEGQLLLTHHPLIFKPLSCLDVHSYPSMVLLEAAKKNISVVAAHTNLDVAPMGINHMLAEHLELQHVMVLKEMGEKEQGLGRIGSLPSALPLSLVVQRVKEILGADRLRLSGDLTAKVGRVAVVGGSGGSLVRDALAKGADLLITGDVGHHAALEARTAGLALVDGGHFLTERHGMRKFTAYLGDVLKGRQWNVDIVFLEEETDPLYWV